MEKDALESTLLGKVCYLTILMSFAFINHVHVCQHKFSCHQSDGL